MRISRFMFKRGFKINFCQPVIYYPCTNDIPTAITQTGCSSPGVAVTAAVVVAAPSSTTLNSTSF